MMHRVFNFYIGNALIILSLVFYAYPSHSDFIDTIRNKLKPCMDSLADSGTDYLPFNQPLSTPIGLHQRVLFPLYEGGFSYGEVVDFNENEVQLAFKEIYQRVDPVLARSYYGIENYLISLIPEDETLFFMKEREGVSYRWVPIESLRRTLKRGDFIKYNKKLSGEIIHGIVERASNNKPFIFIRPVGSENKPFQLSIVGRLAPRARIFHRVFPREIIEVIDMSEDEYWQTFRYPPPSL